LKIYLGKYRYYSVYSISCGNPKAVASKQRTATMTSDWDKFKHLFKRQEVPAKTLLLEEGKISRTMFFIEKGCLRTWVNNNGKEITTQFFFEGDKVSSIESFRGNQPSLYNIESIEPCILQTISQKDFQNVLAHSPEMEKEMQEHLFRRLIQSQKLFFSYLKNTPQQRYQALIEEHPEIIKRVPQHYIASYLGITSVSLSRIRNRR
jgi:CRP-like cAMP-binding protein